MRRQIITIDEERCTGCGACVPDCPEGALQIIDGKARLLGDLFCDGLGACIGACPENAIEVEIREADPYDERLVMVENILPKGKNTIKAHLAHLQDHGADAYLEEALEVLAQSSPELHRELREHFKPEKTTVSQMSGGCPGSLARLFDNEPAGAQESPTQRRAESTELRTWPVQMHLINPAAPHYRKSDFLLAADCTAFAMGSFHREFIRNRTVGIACPKLDAGLDSYREKLVQLIDAEEINTLTVAVMEVPCCSGLVKLAADAVKAAQRNVPIKYVKLSTQGEIQQDIWLQLQQ
jgi:ferredoxin